LVERVESLVAKPVWKRAYREINEFERMLVDDGVDLVKVFLAVTKKEQRRRFKQRLEDPYKQWKITDADIRARAHWKQYVRATDDAFQQTHTGNAPWYLVAGDHKWHARLEVLDLVTTKLGHHSAWLEERIQARDLKALKKDLEQLK